MVKALLLHFACVGVVNSLTLSRAQPTQKPAVPYHGQGNETEVPEEKVVIYQQGRYSELPEDLDGAPELPKSLVGKNLVFAGDHVDRDAVMHICTRYHAKMASFKEVRATESIAGRKFAHAPATSVSSNHLLCHLDDEWNASIMYLWHPGVMSIPPHSQWHQQELKTTWGAHRYETNVNGKPLFVDRSDDLAKVYWRKAIRDHLPDRPTVLVTQSSVWDSFLGIGFLDSLKRPLTLYQEELEEYGWHGVEGLAAWNWTEHATAFLTAVKQGISPEKIIWRTTANCPEFVRESHFFREVSDEQAEIVKHQVAEAAKPQEDAPEHPWAGVTIMDWREIYDTRRRDGCDQTSFKRKGYESLMQTLWQTLDPASHAVDL